MDPATAETVMLLQRGTEEGKYSSEDVVWMGLLLNECVQLLYLSVWQATCLAPSELTAS